MAIGIAYRSFLHFPDGAQAVVARATLPIHVLSIGMANLSKTKIKVAHHPARCLGGSREPGEISRTFARPDLTRMEEGC